MATPKYKVSESVRSTHHQDGAIVLQIRSGRMFGLNRVGSRILAALASRTSGEGEIVDLIRQEFDITSDQAEKDVRDFLGLLAQHELIEASSFEGTRGLNDEARSSNQLQILPAQNSI